MPKKPAPRNQPPVNKPFDPADVKNALTAPTFYCNNIQVQGGALDVWIFFNEIVPNATQFSVERKANVVMSVGQFFAVVGLLNTQAQQLAQQMQEAAAASQQHGIAAPPPNVLPAKQ